MTITRTTIGSVALAIFGVVWLGMAQFAQAADPAPALSITMQAQPFAIEKGDDAVYRVDVRNTTTIGSGLVRVTAVLDGANVQLWEVDDATFSSGCNIADSVLTCYGLIPGRHFDPVTLVPVDGEAHVVVRALAVRCGEILTRARLRHEDKEVTLPDLNSAPATIRIGGCETPTPPPTATPVPPTSTSTPVPPTSTQPPAATPTTTRFVPLPPNTGTGMAEPQYADSVPWAAGSGYLLMFAGLTGGVGSGIAAWTRRRNMRRG